MEAQAAVHKKTKNHRLAQVTLTLTPTLTLTLTLTPTPTLTLIPTPTPTPTPTQECIAEAIAIRTALQSKSDGKAMFSKELEKDQGVLDEVRRPLTHTHPHPPHTHPLPTPASAYRLVHPAGTVAPQEP